MIQTATPDMLPQLKSLWQVCFGDSAAGTDFVFGNLLRPEQILVQTDESGCPVAMLCWKPLNFTAPGKTFAGAYIFGVGTLPEHRGKGISTALLAKTEDILRGQGVRVACLVPASENLFGFYRERGFVTQFYYKLLRVSREEIPAPRRKGRLHPTSLVKFAAQRDRVFNYDTLFGAWDNDYLRYTAAECRFWGGEVLRFTRTNQYPGYAVCYPDGKGGILVKETTVTGSQLDCFLAALYKRFGAQSYQLRLPVDYPLGDSRSSCTLPFAMTKWYYKEDALTANFGDAPWFAFGLDS